MDELLHLVCEGLAQLIIFCLVGLKPFPMIVRAQRFQERKDLFIRVHLSSFILFIYMVRNRHEPSLPVR